MPFAEQNRASGAEAYPALQGEDAPVGLVLIDEVLQSGVDDLDLRPHAGEPPCALDEIVSQVDYGSRHDIGLAAFDIIVNVRHCLVAKPSPSRLSADQHAPRWRPREEFFAGFATGSIEAKRSRCANRGEPWSLNLPCPSKNIG